ncbi:hypothetical protein [Brevundimonas poindexterae]|nr:hypothetical protein [Brevundimonas poindexterae]
MTKIETLPFDRASLGSGRAQQISSNFSRSLAARLANRLLAPLG